MPDVVDVILAEHRQILELFGELADAAGTGAARRADRLDLIWTNLARVLEAHVDTAQEIAWPRLFQGSASRHLPEIAAGHGDIREAIGEAPFQPAGSAVWTLAVRAARTAAIRHIDGIESGPLAMFRREASPQNRELLGDQWLAFQAAQVSDANSAPGRRVSAPTVSRKPLTSGL